MRRSLQHGEVLSRRYRIDALVGSGGMGEVYAARDQVLGRDVAIKILPPHLTTSGERVRRFDNEARAASSLNHPNILTIFDVGNAEVQGSAIHFIVMELVRGETLRTRVAARNALMDNLKLMAQVGDGLAKAHDAGIVHRDLKPDNIMVTADGFAKILDFGLAKLLETDDPSGDAATDTDVLVERTGTGVVMGTVGYMSPEQAQARPVDHRSDIFAFGAILYEVITGRQAFRGESNVETLHKIIYEEPRPLSEAAGDATPGELQRIVRKCLAKDPGARYQSIKDVAIDLREVGRHLGMNSSVHARPASAPSRKQVAAFTMITAAIVSLAVFTWARMRGDSPPPAPQPAVRTVAGIGAKPSIAVLPFSNASARAEDEYLAGGMTESIIAELARNDRLLVTERDSVLAYKEKSPNVREVGRALGVEYVVEGSVERAGDVLRVRTQLTKASGGPPLWQERYDRNAADVRALEHDITGRVIASVLGPSSRDPGERRMPTGSAEAHDLYLRAQYAVSKGERERAVTLFERALEIDPDFALAHAKLGALHADRFHREEAHKDWEERAYLHIEKALALDAELPDAYVARGLLTHTMANGFPHEKAVADFKRSIELAPNATAGRLGLVRVYVHVGLFEEALREIATILRVDPQNSEALDRRINIYFSQRKCAEAAREFAIHPRLGEWRPSDVGRAYFPPAPLHEVLVCNGQYDEAFARIERGKDAARNRSYAVLLAMRGDRKRAEEVIAARDRESSGLGHQHHRWHDAARVYSILGDHDLAIDYLERAAANGLPSYPEFRDDPFLAALRGKPRYESLMAGLKKQWEHYRITLGPPVTPSR